MSREEFMRQLERLLKDVAEEERKEALSYYQSYFEDAGVENEARILRELESPEKVAATIKTDLGMETGPESIKTDLGMETDTGVFTEHGFEDSRFEQKHPISIRKPAGGQQPGAGTGKEQHSGDSSRAEGSQNLAPHFPLVQCARISHPSSVTRIMASHWADGFPSSV